MKPNRVVIGAVMSALVLVAARRPVGAVEVSGGVSLGGILAGAVPRLAVSPHAGVSWRAESGFFFEARNQCSVLLAPGTRGDVGVYDQTTATLGYATERSAFGAGPSLSIYSMTACGASLCGRLAGVAPGGHVRASVYFADPLGVTASLGVDWVGGSSRVLPGGMTVMFVAGPVLRWRSR